VCFAYKFGFLSTWPLHCHVLFNPLKKSRRVCKCMSTRFSCLGDVTEKIFVTDPEGGVCVCVCIIEYLILHRKSWYCACLSRPRIPFYPPPPPVTAKSGSMQICVTLASQGWTLRGGRLWHCCDNSCPCALSEHHAMIAYCGSGGVTPLILDLGTRWR
jgi:hypothetical protein